MLGEIKKIWADLSENIGQIYPVNSLDESSIEIWAYPPPPRRHQPTTLMPEPQNKDQ